MATVSGTFTAVGVSSNLPIGNEPQTVTVSISGTYNQTILIQKATTSAGLSWETLATYSTANATVSESFPVEPNTVVRLNCTVDTSGTSTYSISDAEEVIHAFQDANGSDLLVLKEDSVHFPLATASGNVTFSGTLTFSGANTHSGDVTFSGEVNRALTDATDATLDLSSADVNQKIFTLNRDAGVAVTLPAATGSGKWFEIVIGTTITSNTTTIKVPDASHTITGVAIWDEAGGATAAIFAAGASDDTITLNGSTSGGLVGDVIKCRDIASNLWSVTVIGQTTGTEVTPFSATVS